MTPGLYLNPPVRTTRCTPGTDSRPLVDLPYEELGPGAAALEELMGEFV